MSGESKIRCDAIGCNETHPINHEAENLPGFTFGRWLGWMYLDLNRPDLFPRPLRFCSVWCLRWWIENSVTLDPQRTAVTPLDALLRGPADELADRRGAS